MAHPHLRSSELTPSQSSRRSRGGARPGPSYMPRTGLHSLASLPQRILVCGSNYSTHGRRHRAVEVVSGTPLHVYIPISRNALLSSPPSLLCRSIPTAAARLTCAPHCMHSDFLSFSTRPFVELAATA
jgi:hypothetical protein